MSSSEFKQDEVRKFITVIDTLCDGRVPSWKDESGKPCLFDTFEEAEAEAADIQIPEEDRDEDWEASEPDQVLEVVVTPDKIFDPVDGRVYWEAPALVAAVSSPRLRYA